MARGKNSEDREFNREVAAEAESARLASVDTAGRSRFGTSGATGIPSRSTGVNNQDAGSGSGYFDFSNDTQNRWVSTDPNSAYYQESGGNSIDIDGKKYVQSQDTYDALAKQYGSLVQTAGVKPSDYIYSPEYGNLQEADSAERFTRAYADAKPSSLGELATAFGSTIGVGLTFTAAMGAMYAAGAATGTTAGAGAAGSTAGGTAGAAAGEFSLAAPGAGIGGVGTAGQGLQIPATLGGTAGGLGIGATGAGTSAALLTPGITGGATGIASSLPLGAEVASNASTIAGMNAPAGGGIVQSAMNVGKSIPSKLIDSAKDNPLSTVALANQLLSGGAGAAPTQALDDVSGLPAGDVTGDFSQFNIGVRPNQSILRDGQGNPIFNPGGGLVLSNMR